MGRLEDFSLTARRVASARHVVVGIPTYFARTGEPTTPRDLAAHEAVIYDQEGGGADWTFQRDSPEIAVTLKGRLRVSAAEGVRAAVLANAGIAIVSEWMFAPEMRIARLRLFYRIGNCPGSISGPYSRPVEQQPPKPTPLLSSSKR
jgi:DNA-binding transcriptional LysR family regulator